MTDDRSDIRTSQTDNQGRDRHRDQTNHNNTRDIDVKRHDPNQAQEFGHQGKTNVPNKAGGKGAGFATKGEPNTGFKGEAGGDFKAQNPEFTGKGETGRQGGSRHARPDRPGHRDLTHETRTESRENYTDKQVQHGSTGSKENYIGRNLNANAAQGKGIGDKGEYGNTGTGQGKFGLRDNPGSEYGGTKGLGSELGKPTFKGSGEAAGRIGQAGQNLTQMEPPTDTNDEHYGSQGYKVAGAKTEKKPKDTSPNKMDKTEPGDRGMNKRKDI